MGKSVIVKTLLLGLLVVVGVSFSGCAATTMVKKRNLDVQTKMSDTIFLEPTEPENKIVYLDIRNTSDKDVNVRASVQKAFEARGYRITNSPKEAKYMLQGNILKVSKTDARSAGQMMASSYGTAAFAGTAAYAMTGGGYSKGNLGAGLAVAAVGFLADAMVEDIVYVMVTDLQVRERPLAGEVITQTQAANLKQGTSTSVKQDIKGGKVKWKTYRTRIVSTANKVNLKFEEAQPVLEKALAKSISGIF